MTAATQYSIVYPPKTKYVVAPQGKYTLVVTCPYCSNIHHHEIADQYKLYVEAKCGQGFYIILVQK